MLVVTKVSRRQKQSLGVCSTHRNEWPFSALESLDYSLTRPRDVLLPVYLIPLRVSTEYYSKTKERQAQNLPLHVSVFKLKK